MKQKKLTVTVGIPAYNEEANIERLLKSILKQKQKNYIMKKIIVVSDGSTDKTDEIVKRLKSKKITLLRNNSRLGQALSQNKIIERSATDVLVLLNADVIPKHNMVINHLVSPFLYNTELGIVGGYPAPMPGSNLFEEVINFSVKMKQEAYESLNKNGNLFLCHGRIRAFSKKFLHKFKWDKTFAEDAFSYLSCVSRNYQFLFNKKARVLFRSPQSLSDHLRQSTRFLQASKKQREYFPRTLVKREYTIPKEIIAKVAFKYFFKNPFYFSYYVGVLIYSKLLVLVGTKTNHMWNISSSSKKL